MIADEFFRGVKVRLGLEFGRIPGFQLLLPAEGVGAGGARGAA